MHRHSAQLTKWSLSAQQVLSQIEGTASYVRPLHGDSLLGRLIICALGSEPVLGHLDEEIAVHVHGCNDKHELN